MTTKEEEPKENPETAENPEGPEEENEEEEEPVDLELQKEMKGIKIDDSDFSNKPKEKKHHKKSKNPEDKKGKKKGQDFLDYANKNNIQINIQYEENKFQSKKNNDQKFGDKSGNNYNNKNQYSKGGYKGNNSFQPKKQMGYGNNKFDNFHHFNQQPVPILVEDKDILEFLEKIFGEENLNKDTYIRNRLKEGKILVNDIASYNNIRKNNINDKKIIELLKDSKNLEVVTEDNQNYIKIKDFEKLNLKSIEEILKSKKSNREYKMNPYIPQMPFNGYGYGYGYGFDNNFSNMQNNYYFYGPGYPYSYMPAPENQ
jgi:hypothetical protein